MENKLLFSKIVHLRSHRNVLKLRRELHGLLELADRQVAEVHAVAQTLVAVHEVEGVFQLHQIQNLPLAADHVAVQVVQQTRELEESCEPKLRKVVVDQALQRILCANVAKLAQKLVATAAHFAQNEDLLVVIQGIRNKNFVKLQQVHDFVVQFFQVILVPRLLER